MGTLTLVGQLISKENQIQTTYQCIMGQFGKVRLITPHVFQALEFCYKSILLTVLCQLLYSYKFTFFISKIIKKYNCTTMIKCWSIYIHNAFKGLCILRLIEYFKIDLKYFKQLEF